MAGPVIFFSGRPVFVKIFGKKTYIERVPSWVKHQRAPVIVFFDIIVRLLRPYSFGIICFLTNKNIFFRIIF